MRSSSGLGAGVVDPVMGGSVGSIVVMVGPVSPEEVVSTSPDPSVTALA